MVTSVELGVLISDYIDMKQLKQLLIHAYF